MTCLFVGLKLYVKLMQEDGQIRVLAQLLFLIECEERLEEQEEGQVVEGLSAELTSRNPVVFYEWSGLSNGVFWHLEQDGWQLLFLVITEGLGRDEAHILSRLAFTEHKAILQGHSEFGVLVSDQIECL